MREGFGSGITALCVWLALGTLQVCGALSGCTCPAALLSGLPMPTLVHILLSAAVQTNSSCL